MQQTTVAADNLTMDTDVESVAAEAAQVARLTGKLMDLHEEHRIVLCLHFFERLSLKDIGMLLDDSEDKVREVFVEAVCLITGRSYQKRNAA